MNRWNTLDGSAPRVIAHRGASGELPEHTMHAYVRAACEGADVIEPDLVMSRDGILFARHDLGLSRSTDVAQRPEYAERAREWHGVRDWWVADFDAGELETLRAMQPWPQRDQRYNGLYALPRFEQILEFAHMVRDRTGKPLPVYPEIKHPEYFLQHGLDPVRAVAESLARHGMRGSRAPVWLQCVDHEVLRDVHARCGNRCYALVDEAPQGGDWAGALTPLSGWAAGVAPHRSLLGHPQGGSSGLVEAAHALGLEVHAWTYRDDTDPEPFDSAEAALRFAFGLGVDALFCDFPRSAVALREGMA